MSENRSKNMSADSVVEARPSRKRKWLWILLLASPLALLLVAPTIVAKTSLRNSITNWAVPDLPGSINIEEAGLSWFAPVQLKNVTVVEESGEAIAKIPEIECDRTLWQLATGRYERGNVRVVEPALLLRIRADGSNVEDMVAPFMTGSSESGSMPPLTIDVQHAEVTISHEETGSRSQIQNLTGVIEFEPEQSLPLVDIIGQWTAVGAPTGVSSNGAVSVSLQPPVADANANTVNGQQSQSAVLHVETTELAAGFLEPFVQRLYPQARVSGFVNANVNVSQNANDTSNSLAAVGHIDCRNVTATVPELFGGDQLFFDQADFDGRVEMDGRLFRFDNVKLNSKILKMSADGDARLPDPIAAGTDPVKRVIDQNDRELELVGVVDLPAIAAMLPETLMLHDDLRVDAGQLLARIKTSPAENGRRWMANAKVTQIAGRHKTKTIQWEDPVSVQLIANQTSDSIVIDYLKCDSTFLQVTGKGNANHVQLDGECDLNVLMANVSQFVDAGQQSVAGRMKLNATWDRLADQQSKIVGNATVDDFQLTAANRPPWREKHLEMSLNGQGIGSLTSIETVNQMLFTLISGNDNLKVKLLQPTTLSADNTIPTRIDVSGDLTSWTARLNPFVSLEPWRATGRIAFAGNAGLSFDRLELKDSKLIADDLSVTNGDIVFLERHLEGRVQGEYGNRQSNGFANASLVGQNVNARATNFKFDFGQVPKMSGDVELHAKLSSALKFRSGLQIGGTLDSKGQLSNSDGKTQFALLGTVQQLQLLKPDTGQTRIANAQGAVPTTTWVEPEVKIVAKGQYESNRWNLEGVTLKTNALGVSGQGTAVQSGDVIATDLTGEIGYDLAALSKALEVVLGTQVQVTGTGRQPFKVLGPINLAADSSTMISPDLQASVGVDWQSVKVDRLRIGEGKLLGQLQKQVLRFEKTTMRVDNAGQVTVRPILTFDRGQPVLHLDQDTSINNVVITPELANQWMAYVAPLLANTTDIDGRLSGGLTRATIPLLDTQAADISGVIQIEQAVAKPGSVAQQIAQVVSQIKTLLRRGAGREIGDKTLIRLNKQSVQFRVKDRQVYHKGLIFEIDDFPIQTSGVVGLDQSISLTAQIAIRPEWVRNDRVLARLAEKPLTIPITGTLKRPIIDRGILTNLTRQLGQAATQGLIEDKLGGAINKQLDGVLKDKLGGEINDKLGGALNDKLGGALNNLFRGRN